MKKLSILAPLCAAMIAFLALSGCATVYKTMGVATVATVNAQGEKLDAVQAENARLEAEIAELKAKLDSLTAQLGDAQKAAEDVARIEDLVKDLQGKLDLLPAEVVQRLIDILTKAQAELKKQGH